MKNKEIIKKNFEEIIYRNIENIDSSLFETKDQLEVSSTVDNLYRKTKELLPKEHKGLIEEFDNNRSVQQGLSDNVIYEQGLKDGAILINRLNS